MNPTLPKAIDLPAILVRTPHWVAWRLQTVEGRLTKVPYSAKKGTKASSTDSATWTDYATALKFGKEYDGIGFVVTEELRLIGIDLDKCVDENGEPNAWAQSILCRFDTYKERTPSGKGFRIWLLSDISPDWNRHKKIGDDGDIEIYWTGRYFTVTGQAIPGSLLKICEHTEEFTALYAELFPAIPRNERREYVNSLPSDLSEHELLEKAFAASNGAEIESLFRGDISAHGGDESSADMALVSHLAFYAGANGQDVVDNLFRQSGLMREKWDRKHRGDGATYGQMTIEKVYSDPSQRFYEGETVVYDLQANRSEMQPVNGKRELVNKETPQNEIKTETCQHVNMSTESANEPETEEKWQEIKPIRFDAMVPFPLDVLPSVLSDYIQDVASVVQVPIDLPAMAALAALSFAVSRRWDVQIKNSYIETTNLYIASAMEPGSRKTAALEAIMFPLRHAEKELSDRDKEETEPKREERKALDGLIRRKREEINKIEDPARRLEMVDEIQKLLNATEEPPAAPRLIVEDVTPEKLVGLLIEQAGTLAMISTEGGVFGMMGGRYNEGQSNLDIYLKGHDGEYYRVDRLGRAPEFLEAARLTMCFLVQPDVLQSLSAKKEFKGRGLLGRFLYSIPADLRGERMMDPDAPGLDPEIRGEYGKAIRTLLMYPPCSREKPYNRHVCTFSREALLAHAEYANGIEREQAEDGDLRPFSDWASKLAGRVARIACCLHCLEHRHEIPHEYRISERTVCAAWAIADYLRPHSLKAFDLMSESDVARLALKVAEWLRKQKAKKGDDFERFNSRDVVRDMARQVSGTKAIDEALRVMENYGYVRYCSDRNKRNQKFFFWVVNPMFWEMKPENR